MTEADAAAAEALLAEYGLPENAPQEQLRAITRVAAAVAGTQSAVVNLLDGCFQHQVGSVGFDAGRSDLGDSMCARAIRDPKLQYTPNARLEPLFQRNPWVDGRMAQVRLFASTPLLLADGRVLGTLCVFSEEPGHLTDVQRDALKDLAGHVVSLFELARLSRESQEMSHRAQEAAEQALRLVDDLGLSQERFRLVAEGSSDVVSLVGPDGRTAWISPSVRRVLGHDPRAEIGRSAADHLHPDDRGRLEQARARAFQRAEVAQALVRARHASGTWKWLDTTITPLADGDGVVRQGHLVARDVTQRVQAERRLAASERRYRYLVEHSPEGIAVVVDDQVEFANPAALRIVGAGSVEELRRVGVTSLVAPERADEVRRRAGAALADGSIPPLRQRLHRVDGGWVTVEVSGARVEVDGGRAGIQYVMHDVTEREGAREALRLSEEQHRQLFDAAPVGMMEADADGRILRANVALARLLGYDSTDELAGRDLSGLVHPSERAEQAELIARARAGELDSWDRDRQMVRRDGSVVDTVILKRVVRADTGTVHRFLISLIDMSTRAGARRALEAANHALHVARRDAAEHEALVSAVLETIDVAVVACDAEGRLTLFNRAAREMHALDADSTVRADQWAREYQLHAEDGVTLLGADDVPLARALRDGEVSDAIMVIAPAGRPPRTVRVDGRTLEGDATGVLGAVVAMTDITALRTQAGDLARARDAALDADRAKSSFLATVSHEIRTPLHGIQGMLELLLLHDLADDQRDRARIAHASARTMAAMLNDILDLSKGEAGETRLRPRPVDLVRLARDVGDSLRGAAHLKGLSLEVAVGDEVPPGVRADPDRLRQILLNLVGNAVKFTVAGSVTLAVGAPVEGHVLFTVTDTGPGIDVGELEYLFQPFQQGVAGADRGGTGLGLALCRQLADLMGGTIGLESRPGRTVFTVDLPLPVVAPGDGDVDADGSDGVDGLDDVHGLYDVDGLYDVPGLDAVPGLDGVGGFDDVPGAGSDDVATGGVDTDGLATDHVATGGVVSVGVVPAPRTSQAPRPADALRSGPLRPGLHPADRLATEPISVLLVDDNETNRLVGAALLRQLGAEVTVAESGAEALEVAAGTRFDLILLDRHMPGLDGLATSRALRDRPETAAVRIVALTGAVGDDQRQECLDAGMDDFVTKPVGRAALARLLEAAREPAGPAPG